MPPRIAVGTFLWLAAGGYLVWNYHDHPGWVQLLIVFNLFCPAALVASRQPRRAARSAVINVLGFAAGCVLWRWIGLSLTSANVHDDDLLAYPHNPLGNLQMYSVLVHTGLAAVFLVAFIGYSRLVIRRGTQEE